jgi:hypothetical protein
LKRSSSDGAVPYATPPMPIAPKPIGLNSVSPIFRVSMSTRMSGWNGERSKDAILYLFPPDVTLWLGHEIHHVHSSTHATHALWGHECFDLAGRQQLDQAAMRTRSKPPLTLHNPCASDGQTMLGPMPAACEIILNYRQQ